MWMLVRLPEVWNALMQFQSCDQIEKKNERLRERASDECCKKWAYSTSYTSSDLALLCLFNRPRQLNYCRRARWQVDWKLFFHSRIDKKTEKLENWKVFSHPILSSSFSLLSWGTNLHEHQILTSESCSWKSEIYRSRISHSSPLFQFVDVMHGENVWKASKNQFWHNFVLQQRVSNSRVAKMCVFFLSIRFNWISLVVRLWLSSSC